jgi:hypothetical protein
MFNMLPESGTQNQMNMRGCTLEWELAPLYVSYAASRAAIAWG